MSSFIALKAYRFMRPIKHFLKPIYEFARGLMAGAVRIATPLRLSKHDKLHLGCGPHRIEGWANIDVSGWRNIMWDLRKPLPVPASSVRFIYSEHFIEHITRPEALALFGNCRTVLAKGGVLRVSTPNLRRLVNDYIAGNIPTFSHAASWRPVTPCVMVNEGMRLWGHTFCYDEEELILLFKEAGFSNIRRMRWHESEHPALRGLETRPYYDDLIFEAIA